MGKQIENLGKEIKADLKLQREAMDLVVPELVSLRQKCRNKLKPKSPQQDHENRNPPAATGPGGGARQLLR